MLVCIHGLRRARKTSAAIEAMRLLNERRNASIVYLNAFTPLPDLKVIEGMSVVVDGPQFIEGFAPWYQAAVAAGVPARHVVLDVPDLPDSVGKCPQDWLPETGHFWHTDFKRGDEGWTAELAAFIA